MAVTCLWHLACLSSTALTSAVSLNTPFHASLALLTDLSATVRAAALELVPKLVEKRGLEKGALIAMEEVARVVRLPEDSRGALRAQGS